MNKNAWRAFFSLLCAFQASPVAAQPPMPFGGWTANSGQISTTCPSGFTCTGIVDSFNFSQRLVSDPIAGKSYIQTIIADGSTLSVENFVQRSDPNAASQPFGIANKQTIFALTSNPFDNSDGVFDSTTEINLGWAASSSSANLSMSQDMSEIMPTIRTDSMDFWSFYQYDANYDTSGNVTGQSMDISQTLTQPVHVDQWYSHGTTCYVSTCPADAKDSQVYVLRQRGGDMQPTSGSITNSSGQTVSWNPGDTIRASWTGQLMNHTKYILSYNPTLYPIGFEMLASDIETYDNLNDSQRPIMQFNYGDPNHTLWDPAFGLAPRMPRPVVGVTVPSSGTGTPSVGPLAAISGSVNGALIPNTNMLADMFVPFDSWSANAGTINWACPVGFICEGAIVGEGFLQRNLVKIDTGEAYIQTTITDKSATGSAGTVGFSNESLVRVNAGTSVNGIAAKQVVKDSSLGDFESIAQIRTGWADQIGTATVDLTQNISSLKQFAANTDIGMGFHYASNNDALGNLTGFSLDIRQYDVGTASLDSNRLMLTRPYDLGAFVRREVAGDMLTTTGSVIGGPTATQTVNWLAGDDVQVTWISQYFSWNESVGDRTASFWYQTYDNVSDSQNPSSHADYRNGPGPYMWDSATFGTQPATP